MTFGEEMAKKDQRLLESLKICIIWYGCIFFSCFAILNPLHTSDMSLVGSWVQSHWTNKTLTATNIFPWMGMGTIGVHSQVKLLCSSHVWGVVLSVRLWWKQNVQMNMSIFPRLTGAMIWRMIRLRKFRHSIVQLSTEMKKKQDLSLLTTSMM